MPRHHDPKCTGCPSCPGQLGAKYLAMLLETPAEAAVRLTAETQRQRTAHMPLAARRSALTTMRGLEELEDMPSGYRESLENRAPIQSDIDPTCDPNYRPYGRPPDSYKLALALRQISKENAS